MRSIKRGVESIELIFPNVFPLVVYRDGECRIDSEHASLESCDVVGFYIHFSKVIFNEFSSLLVVGGHDDVYFVYTIW